MLSAPMWEISSRLLTFGLIMSQAGNITCSNVFVVEFFFQLELWSFMDRILGTCMQTIYIMCFLPACFISLFKPGFLPTRRSKDQTLTTCIRVWIICYPTSGATWPRSKGNVNTYSIHGANGYDRLSYKFGSFGRVKKNLHHRPIWDLQKQIMSIINDLLIATKPPRSSPKRWFHCSPPIWCVFFHIWLPI